MGYDNPTLRAAMNAAAKQYGTKSPQYTQARGALNSDLTAHGGHPNTGGIGVTSPNSPGGANNNIPGNHPPGDLNPLQPNFNPNSYGSAVNAGSVIGASNTQLGNYYNNPDYNGAFGSQNTTLDANGHPVVNSSLSGGNQSVVNGLQGAATGASGSISDFLSGAPGGRLSGLAGSIFDTNTGAGRVSGLEQTYARDKEQLAQTLANKGITEGSDLYNQEMGTLDDQHDKNVRDASTGASQQVLGSLGSLNQIGQAGYFDPSKGQVAPFNATQFQGPNPNEYYGTYQGGQNVAGTNSANKIIGAGHDAAGIQVANITGKASIAKSIIDGQRQSPTFTQ